MLHIVINLSCNVCDEPSEAFEGAIYTPGMVREELRAEGWERRRSDATGGLNDVCPTCAAKLAARKKAA